MNKLETLDRLPPWDEGAEQGVLGCCLLDPQNAIGEATEFFKGAGAEVFYDGRHQELWRVLTGMYERGEGIDAVTVKAKALEGPAAAVHESMGNWLSGLQDGVPSAANLPYYLPIVRDRWLLRLVANLGTVAARAAMEPGAAAEAVVEGLERGVSRIGEVQFQGKELTIRELVLKAVDRIENYHRGHGQLRGLATGFEYFDKMTSGMLPGQFWIIGARPSTGKTMFAMNIVEHVAINCRVPVGVFELEMTGDELTERMLFARARVDHQRFRTGFMEQRDAPGLLNAAGAIAKAAIYIDDTGGIAFAEFRAKLRRWVRQYGLKVVFVDHLGLFACDPKYRREALGEISRGMKSLAKELGITIVGLSQLNRETEKERSRKPQLADLRECGDLEQDADLVGFLYEPKLNEEEEDAAMEQMGSDWSMQNRRLNLLVAKQRNGPTGDCEFIVRRAFFKFEEYRRTATAAKYDNARKKREARRQEEDSVMPSVGELFGG